MKIDKQRIENLQYAFISIVFGTLAGLATYYLFLYYEIDILGWNLGLLFSPLVAGYVETITARKLIGESIGAISAFILFLVTVIYGFIIANPTLGYNVITVGAIIVIVQAAVPTFVNYFLIVVIIGTLSYLTGFFKKFTDAIDNAIRKLFGKSEKPIDVIPIFNDEESNERINSLDFTFITNTNPPNLKYENIRFFYATTVFERNTHLFHLSPEEVERKHLNELKQGKDDCLERLAQKIKKAGGNGVVDLEINYILNGLGGSDFQIIASGMGIKIKE